MKKVHVYISGRVQGVFFRAETQRAAVCLNLTGWVRNMRDGRVEAERSGHALEAGDGGEGGAEPRAMFFQVFGKRRTERGGSGSQQPG